MKWNGHGCYTRDRSISNFMHKPSVALMKVHQLQEEWGVRAYLLDLFSDAVWTMKIDTWGNDPEKEGKTSESTLMDW